MLGLLRSRPFARCLHGRVRARPWRPDTGDVDRLSKGGSAKKRGTGNYNIPHRLNNEERPLFDGAQKKGFLVVKNQGYRKARKGNPLPNIWRQWCDAKGVACVVVEQQTLGAEALDVVVVDLTPLRLLDYSQATEAVCHAAEAAGARRLEPSERSVEEVPFNIIPVPGLPQGGLAAAAPRVELPSTAELAALEEAVAAKAAEVREMKAAGLTNQSPEVQFHVQQLLALRQLQTVHDTAAAAVAASTGANDDGDVGNGSYNNCSGGRGAGRHQALEDDHPYAKLAIWQLPATPLFFAAPRALAKAVAKELASLGYTNAAAG